jgi:mannan endo-1,4-beta-mannosidase
VRRQRDSSQARDLHYDEWRRRTPSSTLARRLGSALYHSTDRRSPVQRARFTTLRVSAFLSVVFLFTALIFVYFNTRQLAVPSVCAFSRFVTAQGATLCANGQPLRLIGYNWRWMGTGCQAPTDAEIERTFSQIQQVSKANVVRTAFYQSGSNGGSYTDFDRYIKAAKRHHLYLIPILANQWTSCEPATSPKTAAWYQDGYKLTGDGYPLSYRDYVKTLAAHYANEPAIAFWQLINEPDTAGAPCGASAAQTLRAFADDMVSVVKSVDPHHLVDLGVPGGCAGDTSADYQIIVGGAVEVADVWHDYDRATTPMPALMRQRLAILLRLHKPAFVGEAGICANVRADGACAGVVTQSSIARRASLFNAKLAAGFAAGLSGYIIWNKGSQSVQDDIGPGDPTESVLAKYAATAPLSATTHALPIWPIPSCSPLGRRSLSCEGVVDL